MAPESPLTATISRHIWRSKYRYRTAAGGDRTIEDTWRRIAGALAAVEAKDQERWAARFYGLLEGFRFLPAGRIQAGAGTPHAVTLFNCFVMGVARLAYDAWLKGCTTAPPSAPTRSPARS
jgi:ribonucleoside-diphosphate reductase alpha chain